MRNTVTLGLVAVLLVALAGKVAQVVPVPSQTAAALGGHLAQVDYMDELGGYQELGPSGDYQELGPSPDWGYQELGPSGDYSYQELGPSGDYQELGPSPDWGYQELGPSGDYDDDYDGIPNEYDYYDDDPYDDGYWVYEEEYGTQRRSTQSSPWYVQALPGIGQTIQQVIPRTQVQTVTVPQYITVPQPTYPQPTPTPTKPLPSCAIVADPASVESGGSVVLHWSSRNATSASLSGVGTVPVSGTWTLNNLTSTRTHTLTIVGTGGTSSCTVSVGVYANTPPPAPSTPTCSISAPIRTIYAGDAAAISWTTQNAISAQLSEFGVVSPVGSSLVYPTQSRSYTLHARSVDGQVTSCTIDIAVRQRSEPYYPPYQPIQHPIPSCYLTASPSSVAYGGEIGLTWSSSNATAATLSNVGTVGVSGFTHVRPSASGAYTLSVTGPGGSGSCATQVFVSEAPTPPSPSPTGPSCTISASPTSVTLGSSSTLSWSSSKATKASISGLGDVSVKGSTTVKPVETYKYTLTVSGASGTRSCSTTVKVEAQGTCTFTCGGQTYACTPTVQTAPQICLTQGTVEETGSGTGSKTVWQWFKDLF